MNHSRPSITPPEFVQKWTASIRTERAASQEHFIDICRLLGQPTPNEADPRGDFYAFEKGATKTTGGQGFADVWKRGYFAWEYKGKHKDLVAAYQQLLLYREDLENPPLLVVCDLDRFEIHTNFTNTVRRVFAFTLADIINPVPTATSTFPPLEVLHALFSTPRRLHPEQTIIHVTERAALEFASLAESLRQRGTDPEQAAHFLMRLLFCLFAEDIGLLPRQLFSRLVERTYDRPTEFTMRVRALFAAMGTGGSFGVEDIAYFNGGLFTDDGALDLTHDDLKVLERASRLDWRSVEPVIFGTLFERSLDPAKRAQIGAHYTSREDILLIVDPVLMAPLRRHWARVQEQAWVVIGKRDAATGAAATRYHRSLERLLYNFIGEIIAVRILDPACGSGNFLYVALKRLLDLEKEVVIFATANGLTGFFPRVGPQQLYGIEINIYAHELAQVVVWIGYIQWLYDNGFGVPSSPVLKLLHNIQCTDAILAYDERGQLVEPSWPEVDVIIGNPPFLGGKRLRMELGSSYVDALFSLYKGRVPREADLVMYWFERTRALVAARRAKRAGLLATQAIRSGANRSILERIKETGDIFYAQADRPWILDGAAVRVSMVGFDDGNEQQHLLNQSKDDASDLALANAQLVTNINPNLTSDTDTTRARRLKENLGMCFQGPVKVGQFDIEGALAQQFLTSSNPHGKPNADVIRPWLNGRDITSRSAGKFIIDVGGLTEAEAALYEAPFEYIRYHVLPQRRSNRDRQRREFWWRLGRSGADLKRATEGLPRFICTPRVARHRLFVWVPPRTLPDSRLFAFARADDYFFGVLHSCVHETWALATSSRHGVGNDPTYNNTTCFETFPCPWPPGDEPKGDPCVLAIARAARELVERRDQWLNPPDLTSTQRKQYTLTNLYNKRPAWLDMAHRTLDHVVLDAYGWPHDLADAQILERLFALNLEREPVL